MSHVVQFWFDDGGDRAVRALRDRLEEAGVSSVRGRPHVAFAAAGSIPRQARDILAADLRVVSIPTLWLATLAASPGGGLMLAAVVDTELLAVHSVVHDALAKRVRAPSAYHFPGSWVPHCPLTPEAADVSAGFAALHPVEPVRARVSQVAVVDTHTGDARTLLRVND